MARGTYGPGATGPALALALLATPAMAQQQIGNAEREEEQARAALLVLERVGRRVDFRDVFLMLQAKAMDSVVYFHIF